ncbi:MAG: SAM-dependent methyltransferase [Vicinamibacterales bacterium]|jgi:SAM-dependent MidA family methyltransferase|nr:SAM-dependent methyltransferase [Vicinamibacterales bacterium]HJO37394.1 SAM-dependent methyltransferase [Vicinamibacterales bacterium]|tara:strand:+ start:2386 stop:3519 length:1134 start_codon:yes stop_codon:yes gene_type:complete
MSLRELIVERTRTRGSLTFAEYMELALYHPELGYYTGAAQQSGRAGDFFTSVDVGPWFGRLLAVQVAEMWAVVDPAGSAAQFDLVEAGAGNGRLARDVLDAALETPAFYGALRLHLVERSAEARRAQATVLAAHGPRVASRGPDLPETIRGVIYANELLDAFPVHRVAMTRDGLREIHVDANGGHLVERLEPVRTACLAEHLDDLDVPMPVGSRAEVNLLALDWIHSAAQRLERGFVILIDYGDRAPRLYGAAGRHGTLTAYRQHTDTTEPADWLDAPGDWDLTSHVDLTSVIACAERHGLRCLGALDQTYFLLGLGAAEIAGGAATRNDRAGLTARLAVKTLLQPGGLGSTLKVLLFGKGVGTPALRGCSQGTRLT